MSQHEGVSCDACLKSDFRGRRYKCLTCPNYDLCSNCYESGVRSTRHTPDHPMQCILTRSDYDIFYGGETFNTDQPYSLTCPFCGRMGFTEVTLHEHVVAEHSEGPQEVICPICASLPDCEPNHVTDDFATHLALEHRHLREWDDPQTAMRGRRAPHPTRGVSSNRPRRSQMQFSSAPGLSTFSGSSRESMDPIAELLSQLSGVRRAANLGQSHSNQLQQLQMQLQLERNSGVGNGGNIASGIVGASGSGSGSGSSSGININSSGLSASQRQSASRSIMSRRHQQASSSTPVSGSTQPSSNNYAYKSLANGSSQQPLSSYLVAWEPPSSSGVSTIGNVTLNQPHHYGSSSSFGNNLLIASSEATPSTSTATLTSQNLVNTCTQPILSVNEQEALDIERADRKSVV